MYDALVEIKAADLSGSGRTVYVIKNAMVVSLAMVQFVDKHVIRPNSIVQPRALVAKQNAALPSLIRS